MRWNRTGLLFITLGVVAAGGGCKVGALVQGDAAPACTWFRDSDQDGYGDPADTLDRCDEPAGYVANDQDCNDADPQVNPDTPWHPDGDGDGFGDATSQVTQCTRPAGHLLDGTDCDDANAAINPETVWYADNDMDGYGVTGETMTQCSQPAGYAVQGGDCDDTDQEVKPGTVWHADADGDTYGDAAETRTQCAQPAGYVIDATDCNDMDADEHPGQTWHLDFDADGFGHPGVTMSACARPPLHVVDGRDCDDMNAAVHPGTGTCPFAPADARSCLDILDDGHAEGDGAYTIDTDATGPLLPYTVWCDMTLDGGGWTALTNPSNAGMPASTIPGLSITWSHIGGTSSTCGGAPIIMSANNSYGYKGYDCGNFTNSYTINWPNAFTATDVAFVSSVMGGVTHTLSIDGAQIAADASSSDMVCQFFNGTGAGLPPGTPTNLCSDLWLDQPPVVHDDAFSGALDLTIASGPACNPTCSYGLGFTLYRLYVR